MNDWLLYSLKRYPANEALLRAMEARLFDAPDLPAPCLDLFEGRLLPASDDTLYASARWSATIELLKPYSPNKHPNTTLDSNGFHEQLEKIGRFLAHNATLVLTVPAQEEHTPEAWAALLNQAGFQVDRWQYFFSDDAQFVAQEEQPTWHKWVYDLTGHRTLPWKRIVDPALQRLSPIFEADLTAESGGCLFFIAHKESVDPITQSLPSPNPITVEEFSEEEVEESAENDPSTTPPTTLTQTHMQPIAPPTIPLFNKGWLKGGLALIAAIGAYFGQSILVGEPSRLQGSLLWFGLALAALLILKNAVTPSVSRRKRQPTHWQPHLWLTHARQIKLSIYVACLITAFLAYLMSETPLVAIPLWLIATVVSALNLQFSITDFRDPPDEKTALRPSLISRITRPFTAILDGSAPLAHVVLLAIVTLALFVRYWGVSQHPFVLNGIEAQLGLDAIGVNEAFGVGWLTNPKLPLFLTKLTVSVFGQTTFALRFLSPLIGTATVFATYHIGKRLWNENTGLLAALFLSGSHFHIHYSRLGMSNVWDAFWVLVAMGGIGVAWQTPTRKKWLIVGASIGLSAYFFTSSHLLPLMLVAIFAVAILFHHQMFRTQWQHILAATALALVIALPQIVFYNGHRDLFMERANLLGITRNGWLDREVEETGESANSILQQQFVRSFFGFNATVDKDSSYNPGTPLVHSGVGVLLLLGLGLTVLHWRDMRYNVLLVTFLITITFGGALLVEVPFSRRYIVALPIVFLLAARAMVWLGEHIVQESPRAARYLLPALLSIGILVALLDVGFYFGRYQNEHRFGDRNTEIAYAMSNYINMLEGDWTVYFYAAPAMYSSFSTIPFIASDYTPNQTLFDVTDVTTIPRTKTTNSVHIFIPDRAGDLSLVQSEFPAGAIKTYQGFFADPLFTVYEVTP